MKNIYSLILAVCFLLSLVFLLANQGQNPQWKGKIEYEDGVKVIENPRKPLYGEIKFELEEDLCIGNKKDDNYSFRRARGIAVDDKENIYVSDTDNQRIQKYDRVGRFLQTIGRTAQRNAALEQPMKIILDERTGFLYVLDRRHIKIFNKEGTYLTYIPGRPQDFLLGSDECIFVKSHFSPPGLEEFKIFRKTSLQGKIVKEFAKYSYKPTIGVFYEEMLPGDDYVGLGYDLFITRIDSHTLIYGHSKEYELNVINYDGEPLYKIRKEEPYRKFSKKEKKVDRENRLPPHKPFFHSLFSDSEGRIYVQTNLNRFNSPEWDRKCDVFSKDGYYLYGTVIPRSTHIIRKGYLYKYGPSKNREKSGWQVIRYKIKNWEQIKTGI